MTITYLDQNAASYLALAKSGSHWEAIQSAFIDAFQKHRIICPMPVETLVESAPCDRATRIAIEEFFYNVSGGTRFRSYSEILTDKTLALVRSHHSAVAFATMHSSWGARDEAARLVKESHADTCERMRQRTQAYTFPSSAGEMSAKEIFRSSSLERCGMFWRDLQKFSTVPTTPIAQYSVPWLMSGLVARSMTVAEAHELSESVRCRKWETIFVNFFDLLLGSRWDHDKLHGQRQNYYPNDEVDRWRAAVALGHSDLFITDAYMVDLCRRAKVTDYTSTAVFSTKQADAALQFICE